MATVLRGRAGETLIRAAVGDPERVSTAMLAQGGRVLDLPPGEFAALAIREPGVLGLRAGVARMGSEQLVELQRELAAAARKE
jgi:hypothetical protein